MKHTKPKDWWREVKRFCGLSMGIPDNIFANLEQDTQDPTVLSNLINDTFLEPMLNYPYDNVAVIQYLKTIPQLLFLSKKCCLIYRVSVRVNQVARIIYRIGC
jgi:hypothetical protein